MTDHKSSNLLRVPARVTVTAVLFLACLLSGTAAAHALDARPDGLTAKEWSQVRSQVAYLSHHPRQALNIDSTLVQQAYVKASNAGADQLFGISAAVSGNTMVVGAFREDGGATGVDGDQSDQSAIQSGAAYVFVRDGTGDWSQQAYLKASNTGINDLFGLSVAISGDTVVVGAPEEGSSATGVDGDQGDDSAENAGAAYVFVRDGAGNWSQQAYLKASNTEAGDQFGSSVAVSGDSVVVGAYAEDSSAEGADGDQADNFAQDSGAAYVFERDGGGNWSQQAYLKASNTGSGDRFGLSAAFSGETIVVGAPFEQSFATGVDGNGDNDASDNSGAAYVFVRDGGGNWTQQAYLKASNTGVGDSFGRAVAISGDTAVAGAPGEESAATGVDGDQTDDSASDAGAAYVFVRDGGGSWSQQAYLKASNTGAGDGFGEAVAVSGDRLVVGAPDEDSSAVFVGGDQDDNSADGAGAAYAWVRDGSTWTQQAYLKASNAEAGDRFGLSVGASQDSLIAGAPEEYGNAGGIDGDQGNNDAPLAGAIYVFTDGFTIGGTVNGLAGTGLVLQNNDGDDLEIAANGSFTFPRGLEDGESYYATIAAQPSNLSQTCELSNETGTLAGADVTDIVVDCVTDDFAIGGTVSGLLGTVVLQNNGGDDLTISQDGNFVFATLLEDGSDYSVSVSSNPADPLQTCAVTNGTGTLSGSDVTAVLVECVNGELAFDPGALQFRAVIGTTGPARNVTLENAGGGELNVTGIGVVDSPFALTGGTCPAAPFTLAPTETCTLAITFSPEQLGDFETVMTITSDAPSSPDDIAITGTAVPASVPATHPRLLLVLALLILCGAALMRTSLRV